MSNKLAGGEKKMRPSFRDTILNIARIQASELRAVIIWAATLFFLLFFAAALETFKSKPPLGGVVIFVNALILLIITLMLGILGTILDRLGVLLPVERGVDSKIEAIGQHIERLAAENRAFQEAANSEARSHEELLLRTIGTFVNYDKYRHARDSFGFNAMVGVDIIKDDNGPDVRVKPNNFGAKVFENPKAAEILYMNTFVTNAATYLDAIEFAVKRGVNVRMLLMRPEEDSPVLIARHRDSIKGRRTRDSIRFFAEEALGSYKKFANLSEELAEVKSKFPSTGTFVLKCYDVSLNCPMIMVREHGDERLPSIAYTGFYVREDASYMPYLEWRGGDFRMIEKFLDIFEAKWRDAIEWPVGI